MVTKKELVVEIAELMLSVLHRLKHSDLLASRNELKKTILWGGPYGKQRSD